MDDFHTRLDNHEARIGTLEQGFEGHNRLFVGHVDEATNQWVDGFAQQLSDVTIQIADFTRWFKEAATFTAKLVLGAVLPPMLGGAWYVVTHFAKIEALLK